MKRTLPHTLHVGQSDYRVKLRKQELYGETNRRSQRIFISPKQGVTSLRDSMLHEALHALLHEAGAAKLLELEEEAEEKLIRLLTPWLLMLLRDNPELVDCLTGDGVHFGPLHLVQD